MIIRSAEFVTSARLPAHYPPATGPEIAFAGRSNVGKSSLINTLLNRKRLVKTSSTPGRTQLLNFFAVNTAFLFVDLPGFGYAKVPHQVQRQWAPMVEHYLSNRPTLKGVVLIIDIRRPPGDSETRLVPWLARLGFAPLLVLTKADKLSKTRQLQGRTLAAQSLGIDPSELVLFSAKTALGRDLLWQRLAALLQMPSSEEAHESF